MLSMEAFSPVLFLFAGLNIELQVNVVLSSWGATLPAILFFTLQVHTQHVSVMNHATKGHLGPPILGVQLCHGATSIACSSQKELSLGSQLLQKAGRGWGEVRNKHQ